MELIHKIRDRLDGTKPRRLSGVFPGEAAVLVSIVYRQGVPHFILTKRTESVSTHKGQISFPGGLWEKGDRDLTQTALRETYEEIGISPEKVEVLGEFNDFQAITDHLVRPIVGLVSSEAAFCLHEGEVAYLLEIPLSFFLNDPPVVKQRLVRGEWIDVYYYDYRGEIVWGLTARIIKDFLDLIT